METTDAYTQYDAADNLQTLTQTFTGGSNVTFSYGWQKNHQRASTGVSNGAFAFVPFTGTTTYGTPDPNNGYTTANAGSGNVNFTYDTNRNLTFDGSNTLTYDVENRLIQAQNLITTSQYLYDPLGNRKQKQVQMGGGSATTQFLNAGGEEIADYNCYSGNCAPWVLTVRGPGGLPVAAITPATGSQAETVVFYHHDVMGSTVASTVPGLSGAAEAYVYSDFGAPAGGSYLAYQFAGYRYDSETGLYYVHARYYNPNLGRFLQTDPIGFQGGNNLYAYVNSDPINLIDPTGLNPQNPVGGDETALSANGFSATGGSISGIGPNPCAGSNPAALNYTIYGGMEHIIDDHIFPQGPNKSTYTFDLGEPGTGPVEVPALFSIVSAYNAYTLTSGVLTGMQGTSASISVVIPTPPSSGAPMNLGAIGFDSNNGNNPTNINTLIVVVPGCTNVVTSYPGLPRSGAKP